MRDSICRNGFAAERPAITVLLAGTLLILAAPVFRGGIVRAAAQPEPQSISGATADLSPNNPPGEWRRPARDFANTRYSPLNEITRENIAGLHVAWSFADGT